MPRALPWLLSVVFAAAVPFVQREVDARLGTFRAQEEALYLWSGEKIKMLVPGLEDLMADVYWLRVVQYFGGQRAFAKDKRFDLLYPLVDITTTLDPRLMVAYRYGAIFLAEPRPIGAGQPEQAIALLDRGARATGAWELRKEQAYFTFFFLKDAERASALLMETSKMPGSPYWLTNMAADMLVRGGQRRVGRRIWQDLYEAHGPRTSPGEVALRNLQYLDALDAIDVLDAAVQRFAAARGRRPSTLEELQAAAGRSLPLVDPSGVPFAYDASSGRISIDKEKSVLWRPQG